MTEVKNDLGEQLKKSIPKVDLIPTIVEQMGTGWSAKIIESKIAKLSWLPWFDDAVQDLLTQHTDGSIQLNAKQFKGLQSLNNTINSGIWNMEKNLEKKYKELERKIKKENSFSSSEKNVLYAKLNAAASIANTPEELEALYNLDSVPWFLRLRAKSFEKFQEDGSAQFKEFLNLCNNAWLKMGEMLSIISHVLRESHNKTNGMREATFDWILSLWFAGKELFVNLIDSGLVSWSEFAEWSIHEHNSRKAIFMETTDRLLLEGKLAWNDFADTCVKNRELMWTWFTTTTERLINDGKVKWNDFADTCVKNRELMWAWFTSMTEKLINDGKLEWNDFADTCVKNRELMWTWFTTTTERLINDGKVKWNDFADTCVKNRELMWTWFTTTTERLINDGKLEWNAFADTCVKNRELLWTWFTSMAEKLINDGKLEWNAFADTCVKNRELLWTWFTSMAEKLINDGKLEWNALTLWAKDFKDTVGTAIISIGQWLLEAGKISLKVLVGWLLIIWFVMFEIASLLIAWSKYTWEKLVTLWKWLIGLMYEAGVGIGDIYTWISENFKHHSTLTLNWINEVVKDAKIVFSALLELGSIKLYEWLTWLSMKYRDYVSMWKDIKERKNVKVEQFLWWVWASWQSISKKTLAFSQNVADFVDYLVQGGVYTIDQIGKFFVDSGHKTSEFFNYLIESGARWVDTVIDWFESSYKTLALAYDKMLELGVSTWNILWEKMYKLGVDMATISKLTLKRADVKVDQLCDMLFDLAGRWKEAIQGIIAIVSKELHLQRENVMNWALAKYNKYLDSKQAMERALADSLKWFDLKVSEMGDRLLAQWVSAKESAQLLARNFTDNLASVEKYIISRSDKFKADYNIWKANTKSSIKSNLDDITEGIGDWFKDLIVT